MCLPHSGNQIGFQKFYVLFNEESRLEPGAVLFPFTLYPDDHHLALALQMDTTSPVSVDSVIFGLWTDLSTELPSRACLDNRKDSVATFLDDTDVQWEAGRPALHITTTFEQWLDLLSAVHDDGKLPAKPRRKGQVKKSNRRLEKDSLEVAGKFLD